MGKDLLIKILQDQLQVSRADITRLNLTVNSLNQTIEGLNQTIEDLHRTIANLEAMLKERDKNMEKAEAQMRGLKSTFLPKKTEKRQPEQKSERSKGL